MASLITAERLRQLLNYDPETGIFRRKVSHSNRVRVGDVAGSAGVQSPNDPQGRLGINVDGKKYIGHRLAWLYVHGDWPPADIDHRNGDPMDNRLSNLRLATRSQNLGNRRVRRDSGSGLKGVSRSSDKRRWCARLQRKHLGTFDSKEDAHAAYMRAARDIYGEFANAGHRG